MSNYGLPDYRQPSPLVEVPNETTGSDGSKLPPWAADERDRRLMLAEEILSDLATGYWTAILDDHDDPVSEKMGQRILNYWRKNAEIADRGSGKEAKWQELVNAAEREFPDLDTITTDPSNKLLVATVRRWVQMYQSVTEKLSGCESIIDLMTDQINWQKQRIAELERKATTTTRKTAMRHNDGDERRAGNERRSENQP